MIQIPVGDIGMDFAKDMFDPLYGNRRQWFTYDLLSNGEAPKGSLPNVTGGRLEWNANANVKGGGVINIQSASRDEIDWLNRRIKIVMHIEDHGAFPLGVFIPSVPAENWSDTSLSLDIELLDKCSLLDNDYVLNTYSVNDGANVTDTVRSLITGAGEKAGSITDGSETLNAGMTWEPGTSKLEIINDLLAAAHYHSLRADGDGRFRVERNYLPKNRPVVFQFIDDAQSVYVPDFVYEKDVYSIPNKVVLIAAGNGDSEGMRAVATNESANSPYSYQNRGRWIVDVTTGVEATSQAVLNDRAQARLHNLTTPSGTVTITHAPLPWLNINEVVRFKRTDAHIDMHGAVASTQISLDPEALQSTSLQEVVAL